MSATEKPRKQKPIKATIALPHKLSSNKFDRLTTWQAGIFRRLRDPVEFKIINISEIQRTMSGNEHFTSIIFTLDSHCVSVIQSYFTESTQKPIVKNLSEITLVQSINNFVTSIPDEQIDCDLIYYLTRKYSFAIQNHMAFDISKL